GGDLKQVKNPELFHWKVMGSLWAKTSIALACFTLLAFIAANLVFGGKVFQQDPLLTPIGYLLLIDWTSVWLWKLCAVLAALLSIAIVYLVNDVSGEYRIGQEKGDSSLLKAAERKYGWIERLARFRFLVLLAFWGLVGTQAFLYANSQGLCLSFHPQFLKWT